MKKTFNDKLKRQAALRRAKILREYDAGNSQQAIANKYGVSRQRIQWMLAKARKECAGRAPG